MLIENFCLNIVFKTLVNRRRTEYKFFLKMQYNQSAVYLTATPYTSIMIYTHANTRTYIYHAYFHTHIDAEQFSKKKIWLA